MAQLSSDWFIGTTRDCMPRLASLLTSFTLTSYNLTHNQTTTWFALSFRNNKDNYSYGISNLYYQSFHNIVEFKLLESSVYCYPLRASRFGICLRPNSMGTSLSKTIAKLFETMLDLCTMKIASSRYCLPPPHWFKGREESVRVCNYFLTAIFSMSFTLDDSQLSIARWKMSKIEINPIWLSYGPKSGSTLGICKNIAVTCGGFFLGLTKCLVLWNALKWKEA